MKKFLLLTIAFATMVTSSAYASEYLCHGNLLTMKFTDIDGRTNADYIYVQIWSNDYHNQGVADLFQDSLRRSWKNVKQLTQSEELKTTDPWGGELLVNFKNKKVTVVTRHGNSVTDSISCQFSQTPSFRREYIIMKTFESLRAY